MMTRVEPVDHGLADERVCPACGRCVGELRIGRCPACGAPIGPRDDLRGDRARRGALAHPTPTLIDPGGPIPAEWDLRCRQCGYCLTGLVARRCPECGRAFQPRETWLANRQRGARSNVPPPASWGLFLIWLPLAVSLFVHVPSLLILVAVWLTLELVFFYLDLRRTLLRWAMALAVVVMVLAT